MTTFEIYLWMMLPQIKISFGLISMLGAIASIIWSLVLYNYYYEDYGSINEEEGIKIKKTSKKFCYLAFSLLAIFIFSQSLLPTKGVVLLLISSELLTSIEGVKELPQEFVEFVKEYLNQGLEELKKK